MVDHDTLVALLEFIEPFMHQWPDQQHEINEALSALKSGAVVLVPGGALRDVSVERVRQVEVEEWTLGHDDLHKDGELAAAAACYAISASGCDRSVPNLWPWNAAWWKPKDARRDLVRAGALILAEIERIDRAMLAAKGK